MVSGQTVVMLSGGQAGTRTHAGKAARVKEAPKQESRGFNALLLGSGFCLLDSPCHSLGLLLADFLHKYQK